MSRPRMIALTGGPGAGKTAVLEVLRRAAPRGLHVLPEAASIIFGGGFPRGESLSGIRATQRAIYHVQIELERGAIDEGTHRAILCDRGTLDGAAYWPGEVSELWQDTKTTYQAELARYDAVIHLRTPTAEGGYNNIDNPLRIESAEAAARIDARIEEIWRPHPHRVLIPASKLFLEKLLVTVDALEGLVPELRAEREALLKN